MESFLSGIRYWLVNHPKILNFTWSPPQTPASSLQFLILTIVLYLLLTYFLPRNKPNYYELNQQIIKLITAAHSLALCLFSFIMALGTLLCIIDHVPNFSYIFCFPQHTPASGPIFFWFYIFYLSKVVELVDTLLIILSSSTKRLTFLHVFHHSIAIILCYVGLRTTVSSCLVGMLMNSTVHILVYCYYMLCAVGAKPNWKKAVTDCQIVQFYLGLVAFGMMMYYHFAGLGCSGFETSFFAAAFMAVLIALFHEFRRKNYPSIQGKWVLHQQKSQ